jgi:hypothetical protein
MIGSLMGALLDEGERGGVTTNRPEPETWSRVALRLGARQNDVIRRMT